MLRRVMKSSNRACCYSTFAAAEFTDFTDVNAIGFASPANCRRHRIKRHFVSIANSVTSPIPLPLFATPLRGEQVALQTKKARFSKIVKRAS